ncbi:MAG: S8 family serine peptidase [candidate division Zixibacteria bacterium]|nr:S8 family serine peptidase [candidate division Zixibacteria bacterium]
MQKYFILVIMFIVATVAAAAEIPLQIAPHQPKIGKLLEDSLLTAPAGQRFKIWVFFTDKGIFDTQSYKMTAANLRPLFSERAVNRRVHRTNSPSFDFYDIPVNADYVRSLELLGMEISHQSRWLNAVSGYADYEIIGRLAALRYVAEIKPVARTLPRPEPSYGSFKLRDISPTDLVYGSSFIQLNQINIPRMHRRGFTGKGVLVAIFDTGFKLDHTAFDSLSLVAKYDFINKDTSVGDTTHPSSEPSHGTTTLSVLGGFVPNTLIGAAYDADFAVAKTERTWEEVPAEEDDWAAAAEWADSLGAEIISSSLGYSLWYTSYEDLDGQTAVVTLAAEIAVSRGIAVFNSAGNERQHLFHYITPPADGASVIAMGAVDDEGMITAFSSAGPTYDGRIKPDLVAMGTGVCGANYPSGFSCSHSGTSFAAPLGAGAGALLLQAHPDWSPLQLKDAMLRSADRYNNPDNLYGYGLFDTYKAADFPLITPIDPIYLVVCDSLNLTITVSGMGIEVPNITAVNLPASAIFIADNSKRTADLRYLAKIEDVGLWEPLFIADFGTLADTFHLQLTIATRPQDGGHITVGPNPFSDSLTIFLGSNAGRPTEISIHTANGEKVWDNFTDNYNSARATVTWRGINNSGEKVASGVYFVVVKTERVQTKIKVFKK